MHTSDGSNSVHGFEVWDLWKRFGWDCSLILVDKPDSGRVRSLVFLDFGLGLACCWPNNNRFEVSAFWRGSKGFEVQF